MSEINRKRFCRNLASHFQSTVTNTTLKTDKNKVVDFVRKRHSFTNSWSPEIEALILDAKITAPAFQAVFIMFQTNVRRMKYVSHLNGNFIS